MQIIRSSRLGGLERPHGEMFPYPCPPMRRRLLSSALSFEDQRLQRVAVARGANVRTLSWSSTGDTLFAASGTRNGAQLRSVALKPALTAMRFAVRRNQDGQIHMTA